MVRVIGYSARLEESHDLPSEISVLVSVGAELLVILTILGPVEAARVGPNLGRTAEKRLSLDLQKDLTGRRGKRHIAVQIGPLRIPGEIVVLPRTLGLLGLRQRLGGTLLGPLGGPNWVGEPEVLLADIVTRSDE